MVRFSYKGCTYLLAIYQGRWFAQVHAGDGYWSQPKWVDTPDKGYDVLIKWIYGKE